MKRSIVMLVLVALVLPSVALAADPDFWGVDSRTVPIEAKDTWTDYGGDPTNGDLVFGDWYMQILYFFGRKIANSFNF